MRKRRAPELNTADPLDPQTYRPNPRRLWDCVTMAAGARFPSLRFLATLAWHRSEPHAVLLHKSGPPVDAPAGLMDLELWNEMAWVLGGYRQLRVHTGVCIVVHSSRSSDTYQLKWKVFSPEPVGGTVCQIDWDYEILQKGLHLIHHYVYFRSATPKAYHHSPQHITGESPPALTKRGRWFAPQPHRIDHDPDEPPWVPTLARGFLRRLWERRGCPERMRETDQVFRGLGLHYKKDSRAAVVRRNEALIWLFLQGYIDLESSWDRSTPTHGGIVCVYRRTRREHPVDSLTDFDKEMGLDLLELFTDWVRDLGIGIKHPFALLQMQMKPKCWIRLCSGPCGPVRADLEKRFVPLVTDAILYILCNTHSA